MKEIQPKIYKIAQFGKSIQFAPKIFPLKFIIEFISWLIYLKILVSLHEFAKFSKSWTWKQTFVSTETETANQTEP